MKITRENYEIWFLDYMEGRLNRQEREEVRTFMGQYPDLEEEVANFVQPISSNKELLFPGKEKLKKDKFEDPEIFENAVIASLEGDLNEHENSSLNNWLNKNPEKRLIVRQFENTRVKPDFNFVFPGKEGLKKKSSLRIIWMRVAACAAVLLMLFFLFYPQKQIHVPVVATVIEKAVTPPATKVAAAAPAISGSTKPTAVKHRAAKVTGIREKTLYADEKRSYVPLEMLRTRSVSIKTVEQDFYDLVPIRDFRIQYAANDEMPLSKYLDEKIHELRAGGNAGFFTREGMAVLGLRLFSWVPGRKLTGRKGDDGRLKSISFNTQMLAFSIPVNR